MFKAQGKTVAELKAENDILKSKVSQFESTLKETMRVRDAEIEKLKRVVDVLKIQRCRLLSEKFTGFPLNAMNAESELDKELEAIEKGKGWDESANSPNVTTSTPHTLRAERLAQRHSGCRIDSQSDVQEMQENTLVQRSATN